MKRPDDQLVSVFKGINADPKFNFLVDWLHESLDDCREANDNLDGRELYLNQGEIAALKTILQAIEESGHAHKRIQKKRSFAEATSGIGSALA